MIVENPAALNFLFDEEVFLLASEKGLISAPIIAETGTIAQVDAPSVTPAGTPTISQPAVAETPAEAPTVSIPAVVEIVKPFEPKFLGKNTRRYLITTYYPQHEHIPPEHLTALTAVLKRLNFEADDVAIINLFHHDDAGFEKLTTFFNPQKLLVLGEKAIPAQSGITSINKIEALNGRPALYTFSFDEMMTDVDKKRQFWEQVKNL